MSQLSNYNLDWNVNKTSGISCVVNGEEVYTSNYNALVREDTKSVLGIVGSSYQVIQNSELMHLAERIVPMGFNIVGGGHFDDGRQVYIQLKANDVDVGSSRQVDIIRPYFLLFNGHDGLHSMEGLPTTQRVYCQNTLNMALSEGRRTRMTITIKHTGNIASKIESLYDAVTQYRETESKFIEQTKYLVTKDVDRDWVQNFWLNAYADIFDDIVKENMADIKTESQMRRLTKAKATTMKWAVTWDKESQVFGANRWIALNAATNWVDHDTQFRGEGKGMRRLQSNLLGINAKNKMKMLEHALA